MAKRDYYELLGLDRTSSDGDIKKAYRRLAMECHPDRNPGDNDAEKRFKELSEAYGVLKDGEKRAAYNQFGHAAFDGASGGPGGGFGFTSSALLMCLTIYLEILWGAEGARAPIQGLTCVTISKYLLKIPTVAKAPQFAPPAPRLATIVAGAVPQKDRLLSPATLDKELARFVRSRDFLPSNGRVRLAKALVGSSKTCVAHVVVVAG